MYLWFLIQEPGSDTEERRGYSSIDTKRLRTGRKMYLPNTGATMHNVTGFLALPGEAYSLSTNL